MSNERTENVTKDIVDLSYELLNREMDDGSRPVFSDELMFTLPLVKKSLSLYSSIKEELEDHRLVSASILVRALVEVIVTYVFVSYVEKSEGFYDKFFEHGRLRRRRKSRGWEKVTVASQITWIEENFKVTRLQDVYDNYSEFVHYSPQNIQLILDRRHEEDGMKNVNIIISDNEKHVSDKPFLAAHRSADLMMQLLKIQLKSEVKGKSFKITSISNVEVDEGHTDG